MKILSPNPHLHTHHYGVKERDCSLSYDILTEYSNHRSVGQSGGGPHRFRIRGVPAAVFDSSLNGSSVEVEVYTGHTAVAVTTAGVGHAMNAARAIELAPPALQRPPTGAGLRRLSGAKALPRRPPPLPAPVGYSLKPRPPCH